MNDRTGAAGRLFFDINHPVQALMLRPAIERLEASGYSARIAISGSTPAARRAGK